MDAGNYFSTRGNNSVFRDWVVCFSETALQTKTMSVQVGPECITIQRRTVLANQMKASISCALLSDVCTFILLFTEGFTIIIISVVTFPVSDYLITDVLTTVATKAQLHLSLIRHLPWLLPTDDSGL